ncbi:ribosome small subunit-dependent GTPase A [Agaribacterium sp. ZY112]|uniref:ribosome small subunit-dependent GTPase A n=1 Tax=Agaribacterium sp. ZY112 TaxID=3233574 RepID=UPI003525181B
MSKTLQTLGLVPFFVQQVVEEGLSLDRLARVSSVQRSITTVITENAELQLELAPTLRDAAALDRPTVGDWVLIDEAQTRIEKVLERKSLFKRVGAGSNTDIQPIAANIDTLFIVSSCNEEFKESRLERYLSLCSEAGAEAVIVLTKTDLTDNLDSYIKRARSVQHDIAVETVNAFDHSTLNNVRAWISKNSSIALVGSSGVGKSTLLNALADEQLVATGDIREQDKKGRHTTTYRSLVKLPSGGLMIDVPGMRELKVADIEQAITHVFADIEQLARRCQFKNCQHMSEPGCAVRTALENGELESRRLNSYHKLLRENAQATATLAQKRSQAKDLAKIIKKAKSIKSHKGHKR